MEQFIKIVSPNSGDGDDSNPAVSPTHDEGFHSFTCCDSLDNNCNCIAENCSTILILPGIKSNQMR